MNLGIHVNVSALLLLKPGRFSKTRLRKTREMEIQELLMWKSSTELLTVSLWICVCIEFHKLGDSQNISNEWRLNKPSFFKSAWYEKNEVSKLIPRLSWGRATHRGSSWISSSEKSEQNSDWEDVLLSSFDAI